VLCREFTKNRERVKNGIISNLRSSKKKEKKKKKKEKKKKKKQAKVADLMTGNNPNQEATDENHGPAG